MWYMDSNGLSTTSYTLESGELILVTEMLQLLVLLIWTCLNLTTRGKNQIFDKVFPSTSILARPISALFHGLLSWTLRHSPSTDGAYSVPIEVTPYRLSQTMGNIPPGSREAVLLS